MNLSPLDLVLSKFPDAKRKPSGEYEVLCPTHADNKPSLHIKQGDNGGALVKCRAGCDTATVLAAVGLTLADTMPHKDKPLPGEKWEEVRDSYQFVCAYDYTTANGDLVFQVVRFKVQLKNTATGETKTDKTFRQRRPDGQGGYIKDLIGVTRVPYNLPKIAAAPKNEPIYWCEGERDADNLAKMGVLTTTTAQGAAGFKPAYEYATHFAGRHVVVLPDNDKANVKGERAGLKYAQTVAAALTGIAASARIVELPNRPESGGDVSDWIDAGGTTDELKKLAKAAPVWTRLETKPPPKSEADTKSGDPPHTTDTGNGQRLAKRHGSDLRFCAEWGRWLVWNGKIWEPDPAQLLVMVRAKETALSIYEEAARETGADDIAQARRKNLAVHASRTEGVERLNAMITLARSEPGIPVRVAELDTNRWLLCCDNGTVDLRTGELRPHAQSDLITKKAGCAYLSDATAPRWETFLEQILPDADVRAFFQRAVGYGLTGDVGEQCLFFLYGSGSNGKSTALGALMDMLGDYALQAAPDLLVSKEKNSGPNNEIADLQGARFVATIEVEDGQRMAEGLVKQITGGDKIKARFMRQDYFEFKPSHKIFLAANHQPVIRGQDFAIWRRIKVLPFTVQIADEAKDPTLPDKLRDELPGILAWAVRGCLEWLKSGLREPDAVKAATDAYRGEMDVLRDFIADCCVLRPALTVTAAALYKAYTDWCESNGDRPLGSKNFNTRLKEQKNVHNDRVPPSWGRGWVGIALRSDREAPDEYKMSTDSSDTSDTKNHINSYTKKPYMEIGKIVSEVSELSVIQTLVKTLAALQSECRAELEPGEQICISRIPHQLPNSDVPRIVRANNLGVATDWWAGPATGRPVRQNGFDVMLWERFEYPYYLRDVPPVELPDGVASDVPSANDFDDSDGLSDPFAE